jgi:hypothetical protein
VLLKTHTLVRNRASRLRTLLSLGERGETPRLGRFSGQVEIDVHGHGKLSFLSGLSSGYIDDFGYQQLIASYGNRRLANQVLVGRYKANLLA